MFENESPPRVGIYTEVIQGHHAVSGLNVTAHVSGDDGKEHVVKLLDNGAGKIDCDNNKVTCKLK